MCTRTPLGRQLGDERFGPATSQMLKRVAADPIEFREIYFSVDPRFRDREDEERIEQVRKTFFLPGETDALEKGDGFLPGEDHVPEAVAAYQTHSHCTPRKDAEHSG